MALAFELGDDDLVDVEEAVLLEANLDERRFHPRQDVVDHTEIDVPRDRPALRALEVDLGDTVVFDHGDALLADVDRDQQLTLGGGQRSPSWRLTPTLRPSTSLTGSTTIRRALGPLTLLLLLAGSSLRGPFGLAILLAAGLARCGTFTCRPLASAPAAAASTASIPGGLGLARGL